METLLNIIWASDIHLNFIPLVSRKKFYTELNTAEGDLVLFTGDIAEGDVLEKYLLEFKEYISKPVYFVLGNHDFYGSSVKEVHKKVKQYNWLGKKSFISNGVALVGVDGWADGRLGNYENCPLVMNDWIYIEELRKGYEKEDRIGFARRETGKHLLKAMQKLSDKDAELLKRRVVTAINRGVHKVVIATHVPPFESCCFNEGRVSYDGLPFYSSKILGDTILPIVESNVDVDFIWLCGHTHSGCTVHIRSNLTVKVADARYGFHAIIEFKGC